VASCKHIQAISFQQLTPPVAHQFHKLEGEYETIHNEAICLHTSQHRPSQKPNKQTAYIAGRPVSVAFLSVAVKCQNALELI
jgi:hypothetical protein